MPAYFRWGVGPFRFSTRLTRTQAQKRAAAKQRAAAQERREKRRYARDPENIANHRAWVVQLAAGEPEHKFSRADRAWLASAEGQAAVAQARERNERADERSARTYLCIAYDVHYKNRGTQFCVKTERAIGLDATDYEPASNMVWPLDIPMDDRPDLATMRNGRELEIVLTPDRSAVESISYF